MLIDDLTINILRALIALFATIRIGRLVTRDKIFAPVRIVLARLPRRISNPLLALTSCFDCVTVWISLGIVITYMDRVKLGDRLLTALALAGVASLVGRLYE